MASRVSTGLMIGAVIATAAAAALIERAGGQTEREQRPLASSGDARGVLAARRYLEERGTSVEVLLADSARRARDAGVTLILGPEQRVLSRAEVGRLMQAARRGASVVVFAPDTEPLEQLQPALARKWKVETVRRRGEVPVEVVPGRDPSELVVPWLADPLFGGGQRFHARVRRGIAAEAFQPIAGTGETPVVLRRPYHEGWLYLVSTPSLLENHRIDLGDNLHLLEGLAAIAGGRPVHFDDEHHQPPVITTGSLLRHPAVLGAALQGLTAVILLLLALGRRFGPVRPLVADARRSALEYVESLAALYRRSHQEQALCEATYRELRQTLWRRHGISAGLPLAEAAERFQQRTGLPPEVFLEAAGACLHPRPDLLQAVRAVATLEARLHTRSMA
ncbi:MAG: DUF4350 domain-containing protein [Deltaproteobacteria bacterium]|nr:DUF4350 domain-containing protein [Deltaproteobacteria bacterium]